MWILLTAVGIGLGVVGFAWTSHLSDAGERVAARVVLDGLDVGGLTPGEVEAIVADHAVKVLARAIEVTFEGGSFTIDLGDTGFSYDVRETVLSVMNQRRNGGPLLQFASWVATPLVRSTAPVSWRFDTIAAASIFAEAPELTPIQPVEPVIAVDSRGQVAVTAGRPGATVDLDDLINQLEEIDLLDPPARISARLIQLPPTVSDAEAQEVADELTRLTFSGVRVEAGGRTVLVSPEHLRSHLRIEVGDGEIHYRFDLESLQAGIEGFFQEPLKPLVKPSMMVVDGDVRVIEAGRPPLVCCSSDSAQLLAERILTGDRNTILPVRLAPREETDPEQQAWADGSLITAQVSTFTTPHACCETRVSNIQRMADIVDGVYLLPGESFSLNDFVGPRTRANGFSAAGAIRRGHLIQEVGGGVSQFATTIFNAAYFAGLDFDEYRSHTIYFSRYPYGREATISMPGPDLAINNTTQYPILIDTSYTARSITVSMYSTPNVEVEELEQRVFRVGACTRVETDRQRTYLDGRRVVDTIEALYRPAEGIDCNGRPIPFPETT